MRCRSNNQLNPWRPPPSSPQVITGSHDCQIKLWDLVAGKAMTTLTHHKKAVRALRMHPKEFSFVSAAADNMKKWQVTLMYNTRITFGALGCEALLASPPSSSAAR